MSKKRFELIRNCEDGYRYLFAHIDVTDTYDLVCYRACEWTVDHELDTDHCEFEFVAKVWAKTDSCTHWWFKGENYDPESKSKNNGDAYYHICGPEFLEDMIYCQLFIWEIAGRVHGWEHAWAIGEYKGNKYLNKLIDDMLTRFDILEEEQ